MKKASENRNYIAWFVKKTNDGTFATKDDLFYFVVDALTADFDDWAELSSVVADVIFGYRVDVFRDGIHDKYWFESVGDAIKCADSVRTDDNSVYVLKQRSAGWYDIVKCI